MTTTEEFVGKVLGDTVGLTNTVLAWIGDELGLWKDSRSTAVSPRLSSALTPATQRHQWRRSRGIGSRRDRRRPYERVTRLDAPPNALYGRMAMGGLVLGAFEVDGIEVRAVSDEELHWLSNFIEGTSPGEQP